MLAMLRHALWFVFKVILSLRYRVRVHGRDKIQGLKGPTLILPNHPGYIDPPLVLSALWSTLQPRAMAYESNFHGVFMGSIAKLLNLVPVPDLEQASTQARGQAKEAVAAVIDGLGRGENFILWPAGRLRRGTRENLGGTRSASDILQARPEINVVLVRTRGVWGSSFSYAPTGKSPGFFGPALRGIGWLLANFLFFMPRRSVEITLEVVKPNDLPGLDRDKLNPWLEQWYEADGGEPPTFRPYHFLFGARSFDYPPPPAGAEVDPSKLKPETMQEVAYMLSDALNRPLTAKEQRPETTFDELGLDSIDRMEITLRVEQRFGFTSDQSPVTVGQLYALAQGLLDKGPAKPPPPAWFRQATSNKPPEILGETIPEAFVNRALASRSDVAAADDLAGAITYEKLLVGALTMSRRFAAIDKPNVGLLLPASVACDVAFLGLHLAGKLPVVLNWTTGPANLAHAAEVMGLTHVVTSKAFVDRTGIEVKGTEYVFLEQLRGKIGKWELLRTLLTVQWLGGTIRAGLPKIDPNRAAVVLFTSGSEKAPKAVPLTHHNLISNLRSALEFFGLYRKDSILGFLPAFHSFGISVTGLLPLLAGIKVVHHPDPTDAGGLTRKTASYRPTILVGTPTFVSYIVERAKGDDLTSLRLIVVGAEKCPEALFERCKQLAPRATVLEGYGITECSPVVSGNHPNFNRHGSIGKPIPRVELLVVDLDTDEPVPAGQTGMLLVSGPNVFPGYIAHDGPSPFRERDGKRWYVTGDLVRIDADGFVHFAGRLKRFLKSGGEMISLPALEEPFAVKHPPTEDGPRVAVEGVEAPDGTRIVLFTTEAVSLKDANALLHDKGFRGVWRLNEVRRVDKIPVLGTGKTDYKVLRAQLVPPQPAMT